MTKISFAALSDLYAEIGFDLTERPNEQYWLTRRYEHGPCYRGTFDEMIAWRQGWSWRDAELRAEFAAFKKITA